MSQQTDERTISWMNGSLARIAGDKRRSLSLPRYPSLPPPPPASPSRPTHSFLHSRRPGQGGFQAEGLRTSRHNLCGRLSRHSISRWNIRPDGCICWPLQADVASEPTGKRLLIHNLHPAALVGHLGRPSRVWDALLRVADANKQSSPLGWFRLSGGAIGLRRTD